MNQLKKRILDISYKHGLSHLGSCLTAVDIIDEIYQRKKPDEKFVLSAGHAGLALYVVIEKYFGIDAEKIWRHHGTHPDRCARCHIDCSTGSLGQGLPIAVGMALANRDKNVFCLISDGECAEGSIAEACRISEQYKVNNLKIYLNENGWSAYQRTNKYWYPFYGHQDKCEPDYLIYQTDVEFLFLKGQDAHYHVMTKEEYEDCVGE